MARIDIKKNIIQGKIVYYGPGLCGKTTNLEYINRSSSASKELVSLATEGDRTIFFDYLPIELGKIRGINTNFKLYTVPGQVRYNLTRKMVLKNVDGVVFVADSQRLMLDANLESLDNLYSNMREIRINPDDVPVVLQYNKRDLKDILSPDELDAALNPKREKAFLASAMTGEGVLETLQFVLNVVFKKIAAEFGGDATDKPKKKGSKTLLSHQQPPAPPVPKAKAADKPAPPPPPTEDKDRPIARRGLKKSDTDKKKTSEAATSAFGGKTEKVTSDWIEEKTTTQVPTPTSRIGDAAVPSQSETKATDSSTKSVAKTEQVTTQTQGKKDKESTRQTVQEEQKTASADTSTDAIKEIRELLDKQNKEISKTISEQFAALNRIIEHILTGQSKNEPGGKQDLHALISPIQSVVDNINNRLISLTKENTLTQISEELKDLKRAFGQQSKKADDLLLTSTEINNLRGEMARWMQETQKGTAGSGSAGLSNHQLNNVLERFKQELPAKTDIVEIRNTLAVLDKSVKGSLKGETAVGELKTALEKLIDDALRKELVSALSQIKESVPAKQRLENMEKSIAYLVAKEKEANRRESELKDLTLELAAVVRELRNNRVSGQDATLSHREIADNERLEREMVEQRRMAEPEMDAPLEAAKPRAFEEPPNSPTQNETAETSEQYADFQSTEEVLKTDEASQGLGDETEAEAQSDDSAAEEKQAPPEEDASSQEVSAEDSQLNAEEQAPPEEDAPLSTPQDALSDEVAAEESQLNAEEQAPPEEDADDKNARRIARVMVSDLDLYYSKDVAEGIQTGDFHERLKKQLEEMQKTFNSRVSDEVRTRRDYLGEAIEAFLEKKREQFDLESNSVSEKVA